MPWVGRFYMAINQVSNCSGIFGTPPCSVRYIMTEGNTSTGNPTTNRLTWITPAFSLYDSAPSGGISLVDDPARDANLRAALTANGEGIFLPLADGLMNAGMTDSGDFLYVNGNLRASLCMDGGTWPDQCISPLQ